MKNLFAPDGPYQKMTKASDTSTSSSDKPKKKGDGHSSLALWRKIPHLLNVFQYKLHPEQRGDDSLDYEPIHLHVTPAEIQPGGSVWMQPASNLQAGHGVVSKNELKPENFRFLLEQVPAVRTIEFSGQVDPFHCPYLLQLVEVAYKFNGAESTIYTDGTLLADAIESLVKSHVHTLVIRIHGHKPSQYARLTELPPSRFLQIHNNIVNLLQRRQQTKGALEIELCMTVDLHNFRDMPEMIQYAQELGVDGLRFENYLSGNPIRKSDRTLYTDQPPVMKFLQWMKSSMLPVTKFPIFLPTVLEKDMSNCRNCLDPFTTVSVDADFNISGCSRRLLYHGKSSKIWDSDFWNNDMYQWLRSIHGSIQGSPAIERVEVPVECQYCPRNIAT